MKKYLRISLSEIIGTFVLVTFGCGVAIWTGASLVATSLAFGLVIVAMAYSIGNVSGCHINPAVSLAFAINKKISWKEFGIYVASQLIGAVLGSALLALIFGFYHKEGLFTFVNGFGANAIQGAITSAWGEGSAMSWVVAIISEVVLTFAFVLTILGVTSKSQNKVVAGLVIGGALVLVHLLGIGLTGTSVNPARSFGPAIFATIANFVAGVDNPWNPLIELPIFIVGPLLGGALAALTYRLLDKKTVVAEEA